MSKLTIRWIFLLALACSGVMKTSFLGAEELTSIEPRCACVPEVQDQLESPRQFRLGPFAGQCVDSCRFRRPEVSLSADTAHVANFLHDEFYWKAEVPTDKIERVEVGFEEFLPGISHVFLLFHFSKDHPVSLNPQVSGKARSPTSIHNVVISPEGIPPKDGKYNFFDAYLDRYPIAIRALSKEQVTGWSVVKLGHKVQLFELKVSPSQAREMLRKGLDLADRESFKVKYKLLTNNCATNVADLIDAAVEVNRDKHPLYYKFIYPIERALPLAGPLGTLKTLVARQLIAEKSGRSLLN